MTRDLPSRLDSDDCSAGSTGRNWSSPCTAGRWCRIPRTRPATGHSERSARSGSDYWWVGWTPLRDRAFGKPNTSAFGAFSELLDLLHLHLHQGLAGSRSHAHPWVRLSHRQLRLRSSHGPVIAAFLARPLVEPVQCDDSHCADDPTSRRRKRGCFPGRRA
jgi:hypothetical protein